jgi:hypothetical protein
VSTDEVGEAIRLTYPPPNGTFERLTDSGRYTMRWTYERKNWRA